MCKKGEKVKVHLISGEQFNKDEQLKYDAAETNSFFIYEGSKKVDALHITKDGDTTTLDYLPKAAGLVMLNMEFKSTTTEVDRDKFLKNLEDEGLTKIADKAKNTNLETFKEKSAWFVKTLLSYDKPGGGVYDKTLNDQFEIILQQNPYKKSYGDDITVLVNFMGKPIAGVPVVLYVRTTKGTVYPQQLITDNTGEVYFKLSREGIYMLSAVNMELSKDRAIDFLSWKASLSFAFSSENDLPNTYRNFGFGDKH